MATINATITVNSTDLTSSPLSFSNTMSMFKAGSCNGLELTSGLVTRKFTATTAVDLITAAAQNNWSKVPAATTNANKLYIKNTGSSSTDYVEIVMGDDDSDAGEELLDTGGNSKITLGRLYGGDWMLIPYHAASAVGDIVIIPSTAEATTVEWMLFFE